MSVKAPAEKNFRRARVKPVKKRAPVSWRSWRTGIAVIVACVGLFAAYRATTLVLNAASLQVRTIGVHGNTRLSSGEVRALLDGLRGASILTADLDDYRNRLLESPWVADAALRRVLPSTIDVFISERRPIGLCRLATRLYLLDRTGTIIDEFGPQYSEYDLPMIDGVVRKGAGEPVIDERRTELAARVLEGVAQQKGLASRVSQVDVSDLYNAVVMLDGDSAFLHIGTERFAERLQSYVELEPTLRERVPEIDYVDLRFDERIYVRPVGSTTVQTARRPPAGN